MFIVIGSGCAGDYNSRGVRLFNEGRYSDAFEAFEEGYKVNPESAFSLNNMGYVYEMRDEDYQKAFEFYNKALKACPKEAVGKSTNPKSTQGPLEELIRENLDRVWIKIMRRSEEKVEI
jgi:tetratricopeptide (TPR) repeat protein